MKISAPEKVRFQNGMSFPLIVDAHEDIAWNILTFGRDYTQAANRTRSLEKGKDAPSECGDTLLGWPDYQKGRIALIFSTLFAAPMRRKLGSWETQCYADSNEAHRLYRAQLSVYHDLVEAHSEQFRLVEKKGDLEELEADWNTSVAGHPVGLMVLMEGGEGVRHPDELTSWWEWGVRAIGPAWTGTRFCGGTREPGELTDEGRQLLSGMADHGFILDLSHMDELSARQALDVYPGPIAITHANCASQIPGYSGNRHLHDDVIRALAARDGVIGVMPFCRFLSYDWRPQDGRESITLEDLVDHVDHICQLTGSIDNVGIGSDFDGGFGVNSVPADVDTIADLQKLAPILGRRGYNEAQVAQVLGVNWLNFLKSHLH